MGSDPRGSESDMAQACGYSDDWIQVGLQIRIRSLRRGLRLGVESRGQTQCCCRRASYKCALARSAGGGSSVSLGTSEPVAVPLRRAWSLARRSPGRAGYPPSLANGPCYERRTAAQIAGRRSSRRLSRRPSPRARARPRLAVRWWMQRSSRAGPWSRPLSRRGTGCSQ
jgi:hypothetical protein